MPSIHTTGRCIAPLLALLAVCLSPTSAQPPPRPLPVGYDSPSSDRGGPRLSGGTSWHQEVWPRSIVLAPQPAWGKLTVMFLTNYGGVDTVAELARRFPARVRLVHGERPVLEVAADLRRIYTCATAEEAEQRLAEFEARWDAEYLPIGQSWRRNWVRLIPFFDYPPEIRKVIYTTNAIESVNYSLRKLTRHRGAFPSDEALLKLLYLALRNISKKWTMPIRDWKAALNQFTIRYAERLPQQ